MFSLQAQKLTRSSRSGAFPLLLKKRKILGICDFASKGACSYLGHANPMWQGVNVLSRNKGCLSECRDGGASL